MESWTHAAEFVKDRRVSLAHFRHEGNGREKDTVVAVCEEVFGLGCEMVGNVRNFFDNAQCAQGSLQTVNIVIRKDDMAYFFANVRVA